MILPYCRRSKPGIALAEPGCDRVHCEVLPRSVSRVAKTEPIELEAVVTQALPNAMFKLKVDGMDTEILGFVSGKMRKHFIRILPGDKVKVEITPYDLTKARIVFRQK
jgi:translation initiation factor IF-1